MLQLEEHGAAVDVRQRMQLELQGRGHAEPAHAGVANDPADFFEPRVQQRVAVPAEKEQSVIVGGELFCDPCDRVQVFELSRGHAPAARPQGRFG